MFIKKLRDCAEITAGDQTRLRELLHPDHDPAKIRYSLAVAWLAAGARSRAHKLKTAEVYYLVRGAGVMHIGEGSAQITAGDAVYIPPASVQWLENTGKEEIEFLCIVDPAWRPEDEETL
ncbi:MAG: cupin domain-containing protein [candidate division WOR-3 bacterium]|nr:cupin domain-containing protein [candidate division WOR-3 bacterium]